MSSPLCSTIGSMFLTVASDPEFLLPPRVAVVEGNYVADLSAPTCDILWSPNCASGHDLLICSFIPN